MPQSFTQLHLYQESRSLNKEIGRPHHGESRGVDSSQITIRGGGDDDDDDPTHHPMTPASPYPPYPKLVIFNLSRGTSLRPAAAAHAPCYHAEKLRQQLQAKQQAVQASSTASAEPGEIVLVADVAYIYFFCRSNVTFIGKTLRVTHETGCWFFDLEWELDLGDYPQPNFSDW